MTSWPFDNLRMFGYEAILADPPWPYEMRSEKGYVKSPEAHYQTMPIDQIAALPVAELAARDCYLFLWSTWPHLTAALHVMDRWGFNYVTGGSWTKRTASWNLSFGTGYVLRSSTEPFLVGKIGRPRPGSRSERNLIIAPEIIPDSIEAIRREHSRKPIEMRQMIERLAPKAWRCELFAREPWDGADVWGNQTDHFAVEG